MRSVSRTALPGDDVTLRGVTVADVGSTETDRLSVVRQRSDGVEQAVASRVDICITNHLVVCSNVNNVNDNNNIIIIINNNNNNNNNNN